MQMSEDRDSKSKSKEGYTKQLRDFLNSGTKEAKIATVVLCVLALASIPVLVLGAGAMGNAVQIFKKFKNSSKYSKKQVKSAIESIKRQKLIEYVADKDGKTIVKITKKGETKLRAFTLDLIQIKKPKEWDKKWRLVMFDIPIRFTKGREALRYHLKRLGFFQFQKSAWICPYPCEDEIIFTSDFFGVGQYVEVLTIESILRDDKLKKYFQLL
jgi:DNA-binding transcriptional regulator PaaX